MPLLQLSNSTIAPRKTDKSDGGVIELFAKERDTETGFSFPSKVAEATFIEKTEDRHIRVG
jgi:hypothetical protein